TKGRDPHTVTAEVEVWIEWRVNAMPQHAEH
ncbi:MAG: 1-acyl-sn-glycerol-3-phosphate acyltransferase, partial [Sutterella sp.]|nr:1-acyl-sn-glycerol-3-phosphate acyltransferase [Sutterella sp.]